MPESFGFLHSGEKLLFSQHGRVLVYHIHRYERHNAFSQRGSLKVLYQHATKSTYHDIDKSVDKKRLCCPKAPFFYLDHFIKRKGVGSLRETLILLAKHTCFLFFPSIASVNQPAVEGSPTDQDDTVLHQEGNMMANMTLHSRKYHAPRRKEL